ncbi:MAG: fumarylacetoacetate hydrolase family protein [Clostridiales bacterium]|nr:fumarylacetoacetate hydrolase family protein [Clostridiales bacterium]
MLIARILTDGLDGKRIIYAEYNDGKYFALKGGLSGGFVKTSKTVEAKKILPPVKPSKIIALGANYVKHAEELKLNVGKEPVIFLKPPTSVIGHGDDIVYPACASKVDYEAELAVIISRKCRNVKRGDAHRVIAGYTCANDVSERVFQKQDGQWLRAKGFDTFCPLGPFIASGIDAHDLELKAIVNGEIRQRGNTRDMLHGVFEAIEFVSGVMTLYPGDVILTGTPDGIGEIHIGDTVEIEIANIGALQNKVVKEIR